MPPQRRLIRNWSLGCLLVTLPAIWLFLVAAHSPDCTGKPGCQNPANGIIIPFARLCSLGAVILYVLALIEAVSLCIERKTWRWLCAILPFGAPGLLLFGLLGPKDPVPEYDWFDPSRLKKRRKRRRREERVGGER